MKQQEGAARNTARRRSLVAVGALALMGGGSAFVYSQLRKPEPDAIRIGVGQPLSGPLALMGGDLLNGAMLAAEQINAAGGVKVGPRSLRIEVVAADDSSDPEHGKRVAADLVHAGVLAAIAHLNSGVSIAAAPVYAQAGVPQLAISTKPDYTRLGLATTLRLVANDDVQAKAMAEFARTELHAQRFAMLDDGSPFGRNLMDAATQALPRGEAAPLRLSVDDRTTEFSAVARKLAEAKVDVLLTSVSDFQVEALTRQLSAAGLKNLPIVGGDNSKTPLLEKAEVEGRPIYASTPIIDVAETQGGKAFLKAFKARFGGAPYYGAHYAYDAVHLIASALTRNASLDRAELLERLKTFEGDAPVTSYLRFGPDGEQRSAAVGIYRLYKGEWDLQMRASSW